MVEKKTNTLAEQQPRKEGKTARGLRLRRAARTVILTEATKLQNKVEGTVKTACNLRSPQEIEECSLYLVKELHRMFRFMAISGDLTKLETDITARTKKLTDRWNAEEKQEKDERAKVAAEKAARKKDREKKAAEKAASEGTTPPKDAKGKKGAPPKTGKPADGKRVLPQKVKNTAQKKK